MSADQDPLDFTLEEVASGLALSINDRAKEALAGLHGKLEVAARAAFDAGKDFAVGPMTSDYGGDPFAVRDILAPLSVSVEVKAGPVDRGFEPPAGWRVYLRPDDWEVRP